MLLHAGHNHTVEEKPVPQIVTNTEALIKAFRRTNPKVVVLLAQPITSSKLPKYSYIPSLHAALVKVMDQPPVSYQPEILPYRKTHKGPSPLRNEILRDIEAFMIDLWN